MFEGLNPLEWTVLFGVMVLLFVKRLPEVVRTLARGLNHLRMRSRGIEDEFP